MTKTSNQPGTKVPSAGAEDAPAPSAGRESQEEDLSGGKFTVRSMNYMEVFTFIVKGPIYQEWMPKLSRSDDGTVPVLPCVDCETGEECVLIMPGMFQSWIRRNRPVTGTKLRLKRKGKDSETGAWNLSVERL